MQEQPATSKEFGLNQSELVAIQNMNAIANQTMSNFISYLATERFNYRVTQYTNFKVDNGKLFIWEELPGNDEAPKLETA
jgi:hypothetical protein